MRKACAADRFAVGSGSWQARAASAPPGASRHLRACDISPVRGKGSLLFVRGPEAGHPRGPERTQYARERRHTGLQRAGQYRPARRRDLGGGSGGAGRRDRGRGRWQRRRHPRGGDRAAAGRRQAALSAPRRAGRAERGAQDRGRGGVAPGDRDHGRRRPERSARHRQAGRAPGRSWHARSGAGRRRAGGAQGDRRQALRLPGGELDQGPGLAGRLPGHGLRHQGLLARSLPAPTLFQQHAPLSAGAVPELRSQRRLPAGQRPPAAGGRVEIRQPWPGR